MYFRISLSKKLLVVFLILSLTPLTLVGYVTVDNMMNMRESSVNSAEEIGELSINASMNALENQAKDNLEKIVVEKAEINNLMLKKIESDAMYAAKYLEYLFDTDYFYKNIHNLSDYEYRNIHGNDYYMRKEPINYYDKSNIILTKTQILSPEINQTIKVSEFADSVYKMIKENNPDISWIYATFESGVTRQYPWIEPQVIDPNTTTISYENYELATPINNPSKELVWTHPYLDLAGAGWVVTCSVPLYHKNGEFFGVQSIDITLNSLIKVALSVKVGKTGYAFMIDAEGNTIAFPSRADNDLRWNDTWYENTFNLLDTPNTDFKKVVERMVAGEIGTNEVTFQGVNKYISYAPISVTGWSMGVVVPENEIIESAIATQKVIKEHTENISNKTKSDTMHTINQILIGLFVTILIVSLISFISARSITKPIQKLTQSAKKIGEGYLEYKVKINTGDEIENLANSFNKMTDDLKQNIEELRRATAEKERMLQELEIARVIQQSFIPEACPILENMELAATTKPAKEVGGDFYDFIPVSKDKLGLVIADVSGKGVPAALFMALTRAFIRANAVRDPTIANAIKQANELILEDAKQGMFVTLFYAILDKEKKTFNYVNAGHHPPILLKKSTGDIVLLEAKGIALGVLGNIELEEKEIELESGDMIVLYTDGITDAINDQEEEFGEERLINLISENYTMSALDLINKIKHEVIAFTRDQPQFDDFTLVILKVSSEQVPCNDAPSTYTLRPKTYLHKLNEVSNYG
ncbi:MAG TPA: HAMP domain-containing protein [Methanosarcinales archaeon]|nr:HAMP domain-containing protein [Methanosarcinales archaeon]